MSTDTQAKLEGRGEREKSADTAAAQIKSGLQPFKDTERPATKSKEEIKAFSTDLFRLDGKTAIITGGSKGIGLDLARVFTQCGANVVITSRDETEIQTAAKEVQGLSNNEKSCVGIMADACSMEDIKKTIETTVSTYGGIDILVNNAGLMYSAPIEQLELDKCVELLSVDVVGPWLMCKMCLPYLKESKAPRIINISSINGLQGHKSQSAYSAAKHGIIGVTKALANELAQYNITVNAIAPGPIETDMFESNEESRKHGSLSKVPLKRVGHPRELAGAAVYLASQLSSYTTGTVVSVDGGMCCD